MEGMQKSQNHDMLVKHLYRTEENTNTA